MSLKDQNHDVYVGVCVCGQALIRGAVHDVIFTTWTVVR